MLPARSEFEALIRYKAFTRGVSMEQIIAVFGSRSTFDRKMRDPDSVSFGNIKKLSKLLKITRTELMGG